MLYKGDEVREINIKLSEWGLVSEILINGKNIDCTDITEFTITLLGPDKQNFIREIREYK